MHVEESPALGSQRCTPPQAPHRIPCRYMRPPIPFVLVLVALLALGTVLSLVFFQHRADLFMSDGQIPIQSHSDIVVPETEDEDESLELSQQLNQSLTDLEPAKPCRWKIPPQLLDSQFVSDLRFSWSRNKPLNVTRISFLIPTRSLGRTSLEGTELFKTFFPELRRTISPDSKYWFSVYIGFDPGSSCLICGG